MRFPFSTSHERPLSSVPSRIILLLGAALIVLGVWQAAAPKPVARASSLGMPPDISWLRATSLGDPIALSQLLVLYLQAFDNQPGVSVAFRELDYSAVEAWLEIALALDAAAQYPLMMAAQLYAQVPDEPKQRQMLEFVRREFLRDPNRRWRWLAHAAIVAKHRLNDMPLALRYAEDITQHATAAPNWARQMRIFILEDAGEYEAAAVLLGGLLASGEVTDSAEIRFLMQRLEALKSVEKSSKSSKYR